MQEETLQIYQGEKALIDSQIATAKAYPRNVSKAIDNCIATVLRSTDIAESCVYTVPRGVNKKVSGPSVNLAKIIMQFYGNFRAGARVVEIDARTLTSEAVAFDIESNVSVKIQVKRSIWGKEGRYSDDMIVVTGNAANAIALRNAIFAVIPKVLVDQIYAAAQKKIVGDVSTEEKLVAARVRMVTSFKDKYGIGEKEILFAIGKAAIEFITKDDLVTLAGIDTAIKEGDTTVEIAFKGKSPEVEKPKEDRLMLTLMRCETIQQLESFKGSLKTNEHRTFYDECYAKLKTKTENK